MRVPPVVGVVAFVRLVRLLAALNMSVETKSPPGGITIGVTDAFIWMDFCGVCHEGFVS